MRLFTDRIQLDTLAMSALIRSSVFSDWLTRLKNKAEAKARILHRLSQAYLRKARELKERGDEEGQS